MGKLRIHLFGTLELCLDNDTCFRPFAPQVRSFLAYLIYHHDRNVPRQRLLGIFWGKQAETPARRALSHTLWQLRQHTDALDERLIAEADTVRVQLLPDDLLDVEAFEALCRPPPTPISLTEQLHRLEEAIAIYRADFLEDVYDDWALLERERLRDRYLQTLEGSVTLQKQRGAYEDALDTARQLVAADPLRESAHRELMRLYHVLDRPRAALQQFQTLRAALAQELDVQPTSTTLSLCREIVASLEETEAPYLPQKLEPPLLGNLAHLPFVGRKEERAQLLHALKATLQGHGGLAVVRGAAGVGKSRLVQELISDAEWRGFQVGLAKVSPLGAVPPYQLLREALASLLTPLRICQLAEMVEERWLSALVPLFPSIGEQLPNLPKLPPLDLHAEWQRLWEALTRCLQALADISPLLLVLEDVHWADNASLAALPHLAQHLADAPLLLVLTSRIVEAHERPLVLETLEAAGQNAPLTRITLPPFTSDEIDTLLHRALTGRVEDVTFAEQLAVTTGGNALHLLESLKLLFEQGTLIRETGGRWALPKAEFSLEAPTSIRELIEERVARLPSATREMLELAAVLGENADFSVFAAAKIVSTEELPQHLERLRKRGFLLQTGTGYRFEHDLVRSGVYDSLTQPQQQALHRWAGEALESVCPGRIEALAYHFTQGEQWDKAVEYNRRAGDEACAVYAHAEAVTYFTQALEALKHLPRQDNLEARFALHLAREEVYALQGEREAQTEELTRLADLAATIDNEQRQGEVLLLQARYMEATCDYVGVIETTKTAITIAKSQQLAALEAESRLLWGLGARRQGNYETAQAQFEAALELARLARLKDLEVDILRSLGVLLAYRGQYRQSQRHLQVALQIYRQTDDRRGEAETLNNLGSVADYLEDFASAKTWYEESLHVCQAIGYRRGEGDTLNNLGVLADGAGDYQAARDYYEQCLGIYKEINYRQGEAWVLGNLGYLFDLCGDYKKSRAYYEAALAAAREIGDRQSEAANLADMALFLYHSGDHVTARQYSREALSIAQELGDRFVEGHALHNLGHSLAALDESDAALRAYEQAVVLRCGAEEHSLAMESRAGIARVALMKGDITAALAQVERILAQLKDDGLEGLYEPLRVYFTCYQVLRAAGKARADEILDMIWHQLQERGASIRDEDLSRSFMENVVIHREIDAAYHQIQDALTIRLPRVDMPTGRPLTDDETIEVTWTVAAPEDDEIIGKANRRRHRIRRLLREASEQGAEATVNDLAQALDVSARTIKRDLAALRAAGHEITTRGSRAS